MLGKFILTFLFHIIGLILLIIPNQYQGPVVSKLAGISLRALDVTGIGLIVAGTVLLNLCLLVYSRKQIQQLKEIPPKGESGNMK